MHPFLDLTGERFGVPTFPWGWSRLFDPDLRTKAQLRAEGLSIAGLEVAGQLKWRSNRAGNIGGVRTANLYRRSLARPVRPLSPARERSLARAYLARCTCTSCGELHPYCLPTGNGRRCPQGCQSTSPQPQAAA
nr:RRQRL motif-containing zinc-binding protein [Nocardiopsis algeriensis]